MRFQLWRLAFGVLPTTLISTSVLSAQDATSALRRAEIAYRGLTTLTAEFSQTLVNPMLGAPEGTSGRIFLVPPNRFAMRFNEPVGDRIVADGTWLWLYAPSTVPGQVIRQPIPQSGVSSPNLIGQFVDRPLERYEVTYVGEDAVAEETVDVLRLTPLGESLGFRWAEIAVARSDGILRRMDLMEESGQRRVLVFSGIRMQVQIPDGELRFDVPDGVRVIQPDE
jgi:outer membrane lipoprotein carrier protein